MPCPWLKQFEGRTKENGYLLLAYHVNAHHKNNLSRAYVKTLVVVGQFDEHEHLVALLAIQTTNL